MYDSSHSHTARDVGAAPDNHDHHARDVRDAASTDDIAALRRELGAHASRITELQRQVENLQRQLQAERQVGAAVADGAATIRGIASAIRTVAGRHISDRSLIDARELNQLADEIERTT